MPWCTEPQRLMVVTWLVGVCVCVCPLGFLQDSRKLGNCIISITCQQLEIVGLPFQFKALFACYLCNFLTFTGVSSDPASNEDQHTHSRLLSTLQFNLHYEPNGEQSEIQRTRVKSYTAKQHCMLHCMQLKAWANLNMPTQNDVRVMFTKTPLQTRTCTISCNCAWYIKLLLIDLILFQPAYLHAAAKNIPLC